MLPVTSLLTVHQAQLHGTRAARTWSRAVSPSRLGTPVVTTQLCQQPSARARGRDTCVSTPLPFPPWCVAATRRTPDPSHREPGLPRISASAPPLSTGVPCGTGTSSSPPGWQAWWAAHGGPPSWESPPPRPTAPVRKPRVRAPVPQCPGSAPAVADPAGASELSSLRRRNSFWARCFQKAPGRTR